MILSGALLQNYFELASKTRRRKEETLGDLISSLFYQRRQVKLMETLCIKQHERVGKQALCGLGGVPVEGGGWDLLCHHLTPKW